MNSWFAFLSGFGLKTEGKERNIEVMKEKTRLPVPGLFEVCQ